MRSWVLVGCLVLVCAALLMMSFQQGGLIQARVLSPTAKDTTATEIAATSVDVAPAPSTDPYTKLEAYCEQVKAASIADCGEAAPDKDYACRTTGADKVFTDCVANTNPNAIPDLTYPSPSDQP